MGTGTQLPKTSAKQPITCLELRSIDTRIKGGFRLSAITFIGPPATLATASLGALSWLVLTMATIAISGTPLEKKYKTMLDKMIQPLSDFAGGNAFAGLRITTATIEKSLQEIFKGKEEYSSILSDAIKTNFVDDNRIASMKSAVEEKTDDQAVHEFDQLYQQAVNQDEGIGGR